MTQRLLVFIISYFAICLSVSDTHGQNKLSNRSSSELRRSPVSYHMSFDKGAFFEEDFIEISAKKSVEERKIDFPAGKFGRAIRMSFIPDPPDADNMTGIDLDLVTAVMFNTRPGNTMGFNEPFIWGSGRVNPRLGAVAFWAKGAPSFAGPLFEQTSIAFGRKERDLIGIRIGEDNTLAAYLRDARYKRHELETSSQWEQDRWNHVVLNWDWANGLELWLNGKVIASTWGNDGWFETAPPGLFHLPMAGLRYDELYLMDRPLSGPEIKKLMASNTPPAAESPAYRREKADTERLAEYSGADRSEQLPAVTPGQRLSLTEVWPTDVGDGHIPGWNVIDGRNEMAWPHPYSLFTIIPGDGDYHAEKVDLQTPPGATVNYVTLTGNLTDVSVQAGDPDMEAPAQLFSVPAGKQFFYGSMITATEGANFRIPFTETYGTPPGFSGQVQLPLSGEKRIHNVGLYHVGPAPGAPAGQRHPLRLGAPPLDPRTRFAMHAVTARDERKIAVASEATDAGGPQTVDIGAFSRLNIMGTPVEQETGISQVTLSLPVHTNRPRETLFVRMRDPAVPQRLWNQFAVRLEGFEEGVKRLKLTLDFRDLVLAGGDRLWVDLGTAGKTEIRIGDTQNPAALFTENVASYRAEEAYAEKEMVPAKAQYAKQYEFMPWKFTGRQVSINKPYAYGGPFDMLMPAQAVSRVNPDYFPAKYMIKVSGPGFEDGKPENPEQTELITLSNPYGAPEWALYMRDYNRKRWAMADWWAARQNPDGQLGGGWNDDTLFMRGLVDLALDGNNKVRTMIDAVFAGLERTHLYKNGYSNIHPIDRMHTGDFIGERYSTVINNLGQAYAAERAMESAWHLAKPEQTPQYYADAFKSSANVLRWYWGNDGPEASYESKPLDELTEEFRLYTSVFDKYYFYRMTKSNVMHDDFVPLGSARWGSGGDIYTYMLGGSGRNRLGTHPAHAVTWPSGGGPELPRVVLAADNSSLKAAAYSFEPTTRELKMRLARITAGRYKVGLYADPEGTGAAGKPIWTTQRPLSRFDVVTLPVPPRQPVVIQVEQLASHETPEKRPDLAIDPWDVASKGVKIAATIHNLGDGEAEDITVRLLDGDQILQELRIARLEAPTDFVPKRHTVLFANIPTPPRDLRVVVDPDDQIPEILEENNTAPVIPPPDCKVCKLHQ